MKNTSVGLQSTQNSQQFTLPSFMRHFSTFALSAILGLPGIFETLKIEECNIELVCIFWVGDKNNLKPVLLNKCNKVRRVLLSHPKHARSMTLRTWTFAR